MGEILAAPRRAHAVDRSCGRPNVRACLAECFAGMGQAPVLATLDWSTVATLATAFGTLVLAVATFASVRSANRAARVAEAAFQANLRPVLVTSRMQDPMQKIRWVDDHWAHLDGGQGLAELEDGSIYLAISLRNVGTGLAVPIGWWVSPEAARTDRSHEDPRLVSSQTRDLFIAAGRRGVLAGRHP